jgi:hypothetical protein
MRYCIYEIKNLVNGKTYYGQHKEHKGRKLENDGYSGSGILLFKAYKKYGRENFEKTFLLIGDFSKEEIDRFEKCIIRMMRAIGKAEYNITDGGDHSWVPRCKPMPETGKRRISKSLKTFYKKNPEKKKLCWGGKHNTFGTLGKHWKMPEEHQKGEKNNQFGSHWYTNGEVNIKTKECPNEFWKGRIILKKVKKVV